MFNIGTGELLLIMVLALIVLGPDKLPTAARQAGRYLAEFRRISNGFQREFRDAVDSAMGDAPRRGGTAGSLLGGASGFRLPDFPDLPDLADLPDLDATFTPGLLDKPAVALDKPATAPGSARPPVEAEAADTAGGHIDVDGPAGSFQ